MLALHTYNPNTEETKAGGLPRVQGQYGLCCQFHTNLICRVKSYLIINNNKTKNNQAIHRIERGHPFMTMCIHEETIK